MQPTIICRPTIIKTFSFFKLIFERISVATVVANRAIKQRNIPISSEPDWALWYIITRTPENPRSRPAIPKILILELKKSQENRATVSGKMLATITETLASILVTAKNIKPR